MQLRPLGLDGAFEIIPRIFGDSRGFFSETYNAKLFAEAGIDLNFVQDNHSYSAAKGVVRGLHYQLPPFAQDKLVRVTRGAILDVVVDIRKSSPSFGKWISQVVSAQKWNQILVSKGFAHGFMTLADNTEVIYKVTNYYSPEYDRSIRFDDPAIGIDWPIASSDVQLSDKDRNAPLFADAEVFA
ncbi:dTDP-4-dehydrorhamnose 3,5-epimerase [Brucella anthropi]|uniref:dTDP-4-dehydrorhamnose 3,5-epimerase n=1 Tax=Brucella anthropi TaxID=529 RepID=UPI0004ED9C38|nr:dTDP-4-dehydrorhamnose 3,5-epimerase [Brucella anthropi]AIK44301.1 dTDP-4-dehydrorhamnose 3,5-epimerase [Brucella anthropi]